MRSIRRNSMTRGLQLSAVALGLVCAHQAAMAGPFLTDKPFDLTVSAAGTQSAPQGFVTVDQLFQSSTKAGLTQVNAAYTDNSAAVIRFGYRGLPLILQTSQNSPVITLLIPDLNETVVFNSQTARDGNVDDVKEYLKKSGGDILNRLQQLLAQKSPIDPLAGNPSSMQSRMVGDDFDRNFVQFASNIKGDVGTDGGTSNNLIGIGLGYGNYTLAGMTSNVVTLPLSYTFRSDLDPRRQLTIYVPITVSDAGGAKSYGANLGVSYRVPVNDAWALTPAIGYGITGSVDLGSAAAMMGASLTSQYTLRMSGFDLAIGNMVGMYQSTKFSVGDYSFDPKISNTVYRNGLMASIPTALMGQKMALEISFINTQYTGTALFSNQFNEFGLTLGTNKGANSARSYVRAGLTYLQGENDVRGIRLNVGYWF